MTEQPDIDDADDVAEGKAPRSAKSWLAALRKSEIAFGTYQAKCDGFDRLYANLDKLAKDTRDREFQMFWANVEVLKPSIYSRPPVPVVVPRFKDGKPLNRLASELLERAAVTAFELSGINDVMLQIRDDLVVTARGVPWARYETRSESDTDSERACIEHVDRKDFLHELARKWADVGWVAKRSHLTRAEMRKRFAKHSGKAYQDATYSEQKADGENGETDDGLKKACVWEIWSKTRNRVVWVAEGCDVILDEGEPHLKLQGFFPCPRPAYATVQRRSLIPVPDAAFYKDQLEEVNQLTGRIDRLTDALRLRGFYPSGAGDLADAIESAVKNQSDDAIIVGVSNWDVNGTGSSPKDTIVWLPIEAVATVVRGLIDIRRQVIDDIYQITGLSDIMRGSTVASETLGAQQLKSQYGSVRIRDRQEELIRVARDLLAIVAEIMAENFQQRTLLDMSQMEIQSDADIARQTKPLEDQAREIQRSVRQQMADPEVKALAQQNPEEAKRLVDQAMQQINELTAQVEKLKALPTIEKVMKLLRDQRLRPFALDIETDSTIEPDENAQKQRATEYVTAMGGLLAQALPAIQQMPQAAPLLGETIRFAQQQFRVGRQMDQVVEEFVEAMKAMGSAPSGQPDQAAEAAQAAQAKAQADAAAAQAEQQVKLSDAAVRKQEADLRAARDVQDMQARQADEDHKATLRAQDLQIRDAEATIKQQALAAQMTAAAEKHAQDMEAGALNLEILRTKLAQAMTPSTPPAQNTEAA